MVQTQVKADCLTAILNENFLLEPLPEPFRLRPNVSFLITYSEYITYLLSLSKTTDIMLSADVTYLQDLAKTKNFELYPLFLQDIAFALAKEVWYAETFAGEGSVILPFSTNGYEHKVSNYLQSYAQCKSCESVLYAKLDRAHFTGLKIRSQHNDNIFRLAVVLQYMATQTPIVKEINLVYDSSL